MKVDRCSVTAEYGPEKFPFFSLDQITWICHNILPLQSSCISSGLAPNPCFGILGFSCFNSRFRLYCTVPHSTPQFTPATVSPVSRTLQSPFTRAVLLRACVSAVRICAVAVYYFTHPPHHIRFALLCFGVLVGFCLTFSLFSSIYSPLILYYTTVPPGTVPLYYTGARD